MEDQIFIQDNEGNGSDTKVQSYYSSENQNNLAVEANPKSNKTDSNSSILSESNSKETFDVTKEKFHRGDYDYSNELHIGSNVINKEKIIESMPTELTATKALYLTSKATVKAIKSGYDVSNITTSKNLDSSIRNLGKVFSIISIGTLTNDYLTAISNNDPKKAFVSSFNAGLGIAVSFWGPIGPFLAIPTVLISSEYGFAEKIYDYQSQYGFSDDFYNYVERMGEYDVW